MARKQFGKTTGRAVGREQVRKSTGLTEVQQIWLAGLIAFCLGRGTAVFVGTPSTTGSIKLNIYPPDDRCSGSLSLHEDWAELVPELLSDVFEEDIDEAAIVRAVPWLARKAAEVPRDRKPTYAQVPTGEVPQKGS